MPWDPIKLNDGNAIPSIGFGTWKLGNGDKPTDEVEQALSLGFSHIDTAQAYRNEEEAGKAIRESGLAREEVYITTKYSGLNKADIEDSIKDSLKNLGVSFVDLYLIHHPRLAVPDIRTAWEQFEGLQSAGLAKSIGVSNFGVEELETLLATAKVKPAVNQSTEAVDPFTLTADKLLDFADPPTSICIQEAETYPRLRERAWNCH
ncbi:hypothetical protein NMY22_g10244 [Coprinellus aureogranulatus]|nr:hypothetical protein NMY22_g10244 [Coprinellus aureogranulatus]